MPTDPDAPYREYWSDPNSGWTLWRSYNHLTRVTIILTPPPTPLAELMALRKLPIPHAALPLRELKSMLPADGRLDLGWHRDPIEAQHIRERVEAVGLQVEVEHSTEVVYLPYNEKTSMISLIEEEEQSRRVVERMLVAGVKVIDVEH